MYRPARQVVIRFVLLCMFLAGYFVYLSVRYNILTGGVATFLTWSFFVLCTPLADAGFLLDFPLRLIFGIRMVLSEMIVWMLAISLNLVCIFDFPDYYDTTLLTRLFHRILTTPFPYWGIILLSCAGTFLSVLFGDELMDVLHHHDRTFFQSQHFKYELIVVAFFLVVIFGYFGLVATLGIEDKL